MVYEKIENSKKQVTDEYNLNKEKINDLDNKIKVFKINDLDNKIMIFFCDAMINYFTGTLIITFFSDKIVNLLQSGIINIDALCIFNFMLPMISGIVGLKCYVKNHDLKNRLSMITDVKTRSDKLYEQVKYEIEREKLISRNKILINMIDKLEEEKAMLGKLSLKYSFSDKENLDVGNNCVLQNSDLLSKKYEELELLTIKDFLLDKFWRVRIKSQKFLDIFAFGCMFGVFMSFSWNIPVMFMEKFLINSDIFSSITSTIGPFLIGSIGTGICLNKNYKIQKYLFEKLNDDYLGNENLINNVNYDNEDALEKELEKVINEIVDLRINYSRENMKKMEEIDSKLSIKTNNYSYKFDLESNLRECRSIVDDKRIDFDNDRLIKKRIMDKNVID